MSPRPGYRNRNNFLEATMAEIFYPMPDTSPSVLEQLARIRDAERARRSASALFQGVLSAAFTLGMGCLAALFFWAASE